MYVDRMRPWRRTYGTRRWMSGEKSYRQGRQRARGRGWTRKKRRGKERQTTPDSSRLSRNRKLDRGRRHVDLDRSLVTSVELDSRNRCQSLRIVCPAFSSSCFDCRSTEPATVSRGHYSRSRSEKLHLSGDKAVPRAYSRETKFREVRSARD